MIETAQTICIEAAIEQVWDYVQNMQRWANLMPGAQSCTVIDRNDSRWMLKVGAGGLVRTVNILVHVAAWDAPLAVNFTYELENDPVRGSGAYLAVNKSASETEVTLVLRVAGSGPMAPMWEAVCKPLLPQLAKSFAAKLKAEIEQCYGSPQTELTAQSPSVWTALARKLRLNRPNH